jgi:hypothetical protein
MGRLVRWLFLEKMVISREHAADLAKAECERRGDHWEEPIAVYRNYGNWSVITRANTAPFGVRILVDGANGEIRKVIPPLSR